MGRPDPGTRHPRALRPTLRQVLPHPVRVFSADTGGQPGVAILLTYGPNRDWLKNITAAGGGRMRRYGKTFGVTDPAGGHEGRGRAACHPWMAADLRQAAVRGSGTAHQDRLIRFPHFPSPHCWRPTASLRTIANYVDGEGTSVSTRPMFASVHGGGASVHRRRHVGRRLRTGTVNTVLLTGANGIGALVNRTKPAGSRCARLRATTAPVIQSALSLEGGQFGYSARSANGFRCRPSIRPRHHLAPKYNPTTTAQDSRLSQS